MSLAVSQNTPTAAIWLYLQMMHSLLKWGPHCIMTPSTQSVISVWAGGAAIIPVNKEASGSMSVLRLPLFSLHRTHSALLSPHASCACRCGLVVCLCVWRTDVSHLSPSRILTCGKNPKASWRALIRCAQTSKQTLGRCAARQIVTLLHSLHDRVSMITFITSRLAMAALCCHHIDSGDSVDRPAQGAWRLIKCCLRSESFCITWMTNRKDTRVRDRNNSGTDKLTGAHVIFWTLFFFCLLQINLQRRMRVTGLITQGAKRFGSAEYIKSYKVAYSDDGKTWRTYKVRSKDEDMVRRTRAHKQPPPSCTTTHVPTHTASRGTERPDTLSRTRWRTWWDGFLIS